MQTFNHGTPKLGYSIKEACQASSLGKTTLYSHIAAGRLRVTRIGGRTIVPAENLYALIAGEVWLESRVAMSTIVNHR